MCRNATCKTYADMIERSIVCLMILHRQTGVHTGVFCCTGMNIKMTAVLNGYAITFFNLHLEAISLILPEGIGPDVDALPLRGISGAGGVIKAGVRGESCPTIFP